ncbi:MAG: PspC domain-containing protein [Tannerella sp.]|jgi:phage shock protein PspC (stress-responsive transcriptional regulator)|nr:PspC domain-containing protein [Tannerella sp.]
MKKTLTVNLGGIVFHIDEDAYQLLDTYLSNLRIHFSREEGTDEIMNDFEARISELLSERIKLGFRVITIEHIEDVIKRMGKPEEIFAGDEEKQDNENGNASFQESDSKGKKRLMRDPDDCMLGGVASGLAAYFGCGVTAMRLIWIVLFFLPLPIPMVIIYLILWIVTPNAKTAADKLIMRGINVNLANIGKTVTDSFDRVSNQVNDYLQSGEPRSTLQRIADFIVSFVGALLKIGAVLIGILLIPVLLFVVFILLIVVVALIVGSIGSLFWIPGLGTNIEIIQHAPEYLSVLFSVGGIISLGIPLVALIYTFSGKFLKLKPMPSGIKWGLIILWMISLAVCIVSIITVLKLNMADCYSFLYFPAPTPFMTA